MWCYDYHRNGRYSSHGALLKVFGRSVEDIQKLQRPVISECLQAAVMPSVNILRRLCYRIEAMEDCDITEDSLTKLCSDIFKDKYPPLASNNKIFPEMIALRLHCYYNGSCYEEREPPEESDWLPCATIQKVEDVKQREAKLCTNVHKQQDFP